MSDADKLFEELGYEKNEFKNGINYANDDDEISFVDYKDYGKTIDVDKFGCHLTMQELKAINAKVKELRME